MRTEYRYMKKYIASTTGTNYLRCDDTTRLQRDKIKLTHQTSPQLVSCSPPHLRIVIVIDCSRRCLRKSSTPTQ